MEYALAVPPIVTLSGITLSAFGSPPWIEQALITAVAEQAMVAAVAEQAMVDVVA